MLLVLALAACARPIVREAQPFAPVELAAGDSVRLAGTRLVVGVASIADSRCPSDVTCITAGDAIVVVRTGERTDTLHTARQPRALVREGYEVKLEDVRPYPRTDVREPVRVAVLRFAPG